MSERKRRKSGEGSVRAYETKSGRRWLIVYGVRDPASGKRRQRLVRGFTSERDATRELRSRLVKVEEGRYIEPSRQPLADYLEVWLGSLRLAPSTVASYSRNARLHIVPQIGGTPLAALSGTQLSAMYRALETTGRRDGVQGGLSGRTVAYIHSILHRALRDAVRDGLLSSNPADNANPPPPKAAAAPEMRTWEADELRGFLHWSEKSGDPLYVAWLVLATTGLRRGELLALRWKDVSLESGSLVVRRSLGVIQRLGGGQELIEGPTNSGRSRVIEIDEATVGVLKAHRLELGGVNLNLIQPEGLVLPMVDGSARHPERFSRMFRNRLARCRAEAEGLDGLRQIRLHDLRHTHATLMLQAGVHPKIVSERLGHAKISITLDVYSHALPTLQKDAAARMGALLFGNS